MENKYRVTIIESGVAQSGAPIHPRVDVQIISAGRSLGFKEFPTLAQADAWIQSQSAKEPTQ